MIPSHGRFMVARVYHMNPFVCQWYCIWSVISHRISQYDIAIQSHFTFTHDVQFPLFRLIPMKSPFLLVKSQFCPVKSRFPTSCCAQRACRVIASGAWGSLGAQPANAWANWDNRWGNLWELSPGWPGGCHRFYGISIGFLWDVYGIFIWFLGDFYGISIGFMPDL